MWPPGQPDTDTGGPIRFFSTWPQGRPMSAYRIPWWDDYTATRPSKLRTHKLSPARRDQLIDAVVASMRKQKTPYCEGPVRHAIRASLCLQSWPWRDADAEAAEIFEAAFRQRGATRPIWAEGQPDWAQPGFDPFMHTRCIRCGENIPDERLAHASFRNVLKYCSDRCGENHRKVNLANGRTVSPAEYLARCAQRTAEKRTEILECERCGEDFTDADGRIERRRYCSQTCTKQAQRRTEARQCPVCSTIFTVKASDPQVCCSKRCALLLRHRGTHAKPEPEGAEQAPPRQRAAG